MTALLLVVAAYIIGSIPFGYLIVRTTAGADIRKTGSGAIGATNVSRRAGRTAGLLTLFLDVTKGIVAVSTARWLMTPDGVGVTWPVALAALAVITGHIFPVWLGFRGGKGVATGFGAFMILSPFPVVIAMLLLAFVVRVTRYVSLGSMVAVAAIPLLIWLQNRFVQTLPGISILLSASVGAMLLIVFAHRSNIERLLSRAESKFR